MAKKTKQSHVVVLPTAEPQEQPIVEIDQIEVKKALAVLVSKENNVIQELYAKWETYNQQYFEGKLSYPLITVGKLSNRTLGQYIISGHEMGIENHIKFNRHFIALNPMKRVLETLRHEMIHQWQDEVIYVKKGQEKKEGQKARPKEWHNKDFKDMAAIVGIPANGAKCTGNPANMPAPQSYNRKFACGCIASNGYPVTVWSTREIHATCDLCKTKFRELKKNDPTAKTILATQSHVEKKGEDAIEQEMGALGYTEFKRFKTKQELTDFVDEWLAVLTSQQGVYQKFHNQYKQGFRYWYAYTAEPDTSEVEDMPEPPLEPEAVEPAPEPEKPKRKSRAKKADPVELPKLDEPAQPKKRGRKAKGDQQPVSQTEGRSHTNPQDLIDLYNELNTISAVAAYFKMTPAAIVYQAKKHNIDFGKGTFGDGEQ